MKTHYLSRSIQRGFTLVELLIVVIIVAIMAAIAVPQFTAPTDDARSAALSSNLAVLRSAIDLYYQGHGEYPGSKTAVPPAGCTGTQGTGLATGGQGSTAETALIEQLTMYTDEDGGACSVSNATFRFGPYLKKSTLPEDPVKAINTVEVVAAGNLDMSATAGDPGGWKYDTATGKIIVNRSADQGL